MPDADPEGNPENEGDISGYVDVNMVTMQNKLNFKELVKQIELVVDAIFWHLDKKEKNKLANKFMRASDEKRTDIAEPYGGLPYCSYFCFKQSGN